MRVKLGMAQHPAHKNRRFVLVHGQVNHAILPVANAGIVEVFIASEESGAPVPQQERNDPFIPYAASANINPDLPDANPPLLEEEPLASRDVLVQNDHAAVGLRMNSSACDSRAWLASIFT